MVKTVTSAKTPYCSPAMLAQFYDWRPIARLCQDSQTDPDMTYQQFLTSANVAGLLSSASGEAEGAFFRAYRLVAADLVALAGTNAGDYLSNLVAGLAVWGAYQRRTDFRPVPEGAQEAKQQIQALGNGDKIFGFLETAQAGLWDVKPETPEDIQARNGVIYQARAYWGRRARDQRQGW